MIEGSLPGPAVLVALAVAAVAVFVGLLAFTIWWLRRPTSPFRGPNTLLARAAATGTIGGLAMIPVGQLLIFIGFPVGLYSEELARWLLGFSTPSVLFIEHMLISLSLAVGLVLASAPAIRRWSPGRALAWGAAYGALIWLVVNSLALPLAFGKATPWQLGPAAIWPSLLVHLLFGVVVAALARADTIRKTTPPPGTVSATP
jgi:uncharacterized membrane protein YagU involved in acid resistance